MSDFFALAQVLFECFQEDLGILLFTAIFSSQVQRVVAQVEVTNLFYFLLKKYIHQAS